MPRGIFLKATEGIPVHIEGLFWGRGSQISPHPSHPEPETLGAGPASPPGNADVR